MKITKVLIWIGFITLLLVMRHYSLALTKQSRYDIVCLEFAGDEHGKKILQTWASTETGKNNLLRAAEKSTYYDFLFAVFYTTLLFSLSNAAMYREGHPLINELLRLNLPLALLTGLLDFTENFFLLYNIQHWSADEPYYRAGWLAGPKFLLIGWIVFILLVYLFKSVISFFRRTRF